MKAFIPTDLHEVVKSASCTPPFQVVDMQGYGFWNIKEAADRFLNTKNLNISKARHIKFDCRSPTTVMIKETSSDLDRKKVNILKKGLNVSDIKSAKLNLAPPDNKISENKRKSLTSMLSYLEKKEHKLFYQGLLVIPENAVGI